MATTADHVEEATQHKLERYAKFLESMRKEFHIQCDSDVLHIAPPEIARATRSETSCFLLCFSPFSRLSLSEVSEMIRHVCRLVTSSVFHSSALEMANVCNCLCSLCLIVLQNPLMRSRLSVGDTVIDGSLRGGLAAGITELVGEAGSGKTQLCLQWCLQVGPFGVHMRAYLTTLLPGATSRKPRWLRRKRMLPFY